MAGEVNTLIHGRGEVFGATLATGSIVGGDWVYAYQTSTDDLFAASRGDAFTTGSVFVQRVAIGASVNDKVVGIALNNAGSGETTDVSTEGIFIGVSAGAVTAGEKIMCLGQGLVDFNDDASGAAHIIGRAITGASAASKYVLFKLSL